MKLTHKLWIGLGILVILSPLGLILPEYFKAGPAWGEWKVSTFWNAPLPDYAFKGWQARPILSLCFAYMLSAVIGVLLCIGIIFILGKFLSKK